ncbi:MAG: hypothetical protein QM713_16280 [Arachnia sp.]
MSRDTPRRARRTASPGERADRLKESIYLVFASLAVTLAITAHGHVTAGEALSTLAVTLIGTVLAVFTADLLSHVVLHERILTRQEFRQALRTSFGALPAVSLPFIFLGVSAATGWDVSSALLASTVALAASLVLVVWRATRRVRLPRWQRFILLCVEAALALVVVGLQVLAHS